MLTTELITEHDDIKRVLPECIKLARAENASLPFQYMYMPLFWWETFHTTKEGQFWQKRGKNFLGILSSLEDLFLLIARDGDDLCGAVPLVRYALHGVPDKDNVYRIIAFPGDYVLAPFQDFLVRTSLRQAIISMFLERIVFLLRDDVSLFWAGYLPGESPNLTPLRVACSALNGRIASIEAISIQRGGVWPWTIAGISSSVEKINETCDRYGIFVEGLKELVSEINDCSPQGLLFPKTRNNLLAKLNALIPLVRCHESLLESAEKLDSFLQNSPLMYPYIELPSDREKYLDSLSYSTRRYFRRYIKHFVEAGGSFEVVSSENITSEDIEDYIRLHLLRWGKKSEAMCGKSADYHRLLSLSMVKEGLFLLFFARYNDKRIAAHSCFDINDRREGYITGLDPEYSDLRAGRLLYLHTINDAIGKGMKRYDLGVIGFDYKMSFVKKIDLAHNFFLFPQGEPPNLNLIFPSFESMEVI